MKFIFLKVSLLTLMTLSSFAETRKITLTQAYDEVLKTDQTIRNAWYEVQRSKLLKGYAYSKYLPTVNASMNYSDNSSSDRTNLNFSLSQPLLDLSFRASYKKSLLSKEFSSLAYRSTLRSLLFELAQFYYAILKNRQLIAIARETVNLSKDQLAVARKKKKLGLNIRTDILMAKVNLEQSKRNMLETENNLKEGCYELANILNSNASDEDYDLMEPSELPSPDLDTASLIQTALTNSEEYRQAAISLDSWKLTKKEKFASYYPTVSGDFSKSKNLKDSSSSQTESDWSAGIRLSLPLFNAGRRELDLKDINLSISEAELKLQLARKKIVLEVKKVILNIQTLEQYISCLETELKAARENYELFSSKYQIGEATTLELFTALNDFNNSRISLAIQKYNYQIALLDLERVVGIFQKERIDQFESSIKSQD